MKRPKIAVIVPCYNEEKSVVAVIDELLSVLPSAKIYVFDNNSTDKSVALVCEKIAQLSADLEQNAQNSTKFTNPKPNPKKTTQALALS